MIDFIEKPYVQLKQSSRYKMSSDTHHLAAFMEIRKKDKVIDVGTNNGVLALAAAVQTSSHVIGLDIDQDAINLAGENAELNHCQNCEFINCRVQDYQSSVVDVIVSNPPYHSDTRFEEDIMQFDDTLTLDELATHAYRLLKDKGRMYLIIKAYRLLETALIFNEKHFSLRRIQMIHHSMNHQASSVCMEFRKNGKSHLIVDAPIINEVNEEK